MGINDNEIELHHARNLAIEALRASRKASDTFHALNVLKQCKARDERILQNLDPSLDTMLNRARNLASDMLNSGGAWQDSEKHSFAFGILGLCDDLSENNIEDSLP